MPPAPALVGISHGTASADGQRAVTGLLDAVAAAHPELVVAQGYVDVQRPDPVETLAGLAAGHAAVVVPLLLSRGYHVHVDLENAVRVPATRSVTLADPLGPDARLANVLATRLAEAGLRDGDVVVLGVAGSRDPRAVDDCETAARQLANELGHEVTLGFLAAAQPRLDEAVAHLRAAHPGRRVVVASYLLAPGYFQDLAEKAGADIVTEPLLSPHRPAPPPLVDLVLERYRAALRAPS